MKTMPAAAVAAMLSLACMSAAHGQPAATITLASLVTRDSDHDRFAAMPYADLIATEAATHGIPVSLAHAVVAIESTYKPNVTGRAGEVGLMQIKLATAQGMGYRGSRKGLYDPATNIRYGMKYLAGALERGGGTLCGTILKYNAGHYAKRSNPVSARYCEKVKVQLTLS